MTIRHWPKATEDFILSFIVYLSALSLTVVICASPLISIGVSTPEPEAFPARFACKCRMQEI